MRGEQRERGGGARGDRRGQGRWVAWRSLIPLILFLKVGECWWVSVNVDAGAEASLDEYGRS